MDDYISRQDALEMFESTTWYDPRDTDVAHEIIGILPSVQPEQKKGKWEQIEEIPSIRKRFKRYCCSNCKKEGFDTWNYCPECGQRNREGEQ